MTTIKSDSAQTNMIPVNRPLVTSADVQSVCEILEQGWISGEGPVVEEFERRIAACADSSHAVAVSSGTAACDLLSEAYAIRAGDVIISPATTIISTVSQAVRAGARLELVDADPKTWCMSTSQGVEKMDHDVKAIWLVHLFGLPVDADPLIHAARAHDVRVFEDAAEAIGLTYRGRPCGGLADAGIYSFYANKVVTSGEGGAVVTNDSAIAQRVRSLRNLCFRPEERFVHHDLGYNFRFPSASAALAKSQLSRLDELVVRKREIGHRYLAGLKGHPWLTLPVKSTDYADNVFWVFAVVLSPDAPSSAETMRDRLREAGIDSRRFFCPLNLQPVLQSMGAVTAEPMPVSEMLWERGFYLPSGLGTTDEEIDITIEALWRIAR